MNPATAIRVEGLRKSLAAVQVLRGVDFDVERGTVFALLGSNGAGKTTIVRILSTLVRADAGTATVGGLDVATQAPRVRESISLTGQFAAVDEVLTGRENLVLVARLRHLPDPGRIADGLLKRFAGLSAKTVDGASAFSYPLIFLPFISSAFAPTETMPAPVAWFAENQPVTSIVDTIRALFAQQPVGDDIWVALAWCLGILIVAYVIANVVYRRRIR